MNSPGLRIDTRQRQTMTPRLQQAVRLLQLSSLDFAHEVQDMMGRNPFLEGDETPAETQAEERTPAQAEQFAPEPLGGAASDFDAPAERLERQEWMTSAMPRVASPDAQTSLMERMPEETTLRAHLRTQVNLMSLPERDHLLACVVTEALDDDGYLRMDLDELVEWVNRDHGMQSAVDIGEMRIALRLVQSLDPCGVGARSVGECLLLQLDLIHDAAQRELARRAISGHLDHLAHRDAAALARALGCSGDEAEAVLQRIRHFDPRPGWRFGSGNVQFVTPDVLVRKVAGKWTAMLNPAVVPRVRINQTYAELFQQHRDAQHGELAAHLQEARWTVRNVEQRFSTILSVAQAILKRQQHFLEFGSLAMKPLGLKEIAEEVGVHESTVSRVTNNKYMATPAGVFELKYFFSRAMPTASGGACSPLAIRGLIKDMIDAESPSAPLSDAEITRLLTRQGLQVARRTVTKYRQMLDIPAVEHRRPSQ